MFIGIILLIVSGLYLHHEITKPQTEAQKQAIKDFYEEL